METRPVELISLDFDGTIYHSDFFPRLLDIISEESGHPLSAQQRRVAVRFLYTYFGLEYNREERQETTPEAFFALFNDQLMAAMGIMPPQRRRALDAVTERALTLEARSWLEPDLVGWLERVRQRGYTVALLTNRPESIIDFCQKLDIAHLFDFIVTRDTLGVMKPDPAPFHHMLRTAGVPPQRAVHVGDNPFTDIEGAKASHMHAVLVDPQDVFADYEDVWRVRRVVELEKWLRVSPEGT
ncbi:MAG: HAD family hydrolase [Ardenticatenia bacterium]|nr:HAD family hydrolase [Ardenticatenia bacterium]